MNRLLFCVVLVSVILFAHADIGDTFTVNCFPLTQQRSDPIVSPGVASAHVHSIIGGNAFQRNMSDPMAAERANTTTCDKTTDHSNYWVPQLYHGRSDGLFELVPWKGSAVYYQRRACNYSATATACDPKGVPLAFPDGFRMIAGNPARRTQSYTDFAQLAVAMMCIFDGGSREVKGFPAQHCNLLRAEVYFPSCWDGVHLDTPDHQSHMAYPAVGNYNGGVCPQSHPVALFSIFYEFFFDTSQYTDINRFVFAMGDTTGFGFHGDFIMGWMNRTALQNAYSECTASSTCPGLGNKGESFEPLIYPAIYEEPIGLNGPIAKLPGNNSVDWNKHYTPRALFATKAGAYWVSSGPTAPIKVTGTAATASLFTVGGENGVSWLQNTADLYFVSADGAGSLALQADKDYPGMWESFTLQQQADGTYAVFSEADNKYVAVQADGTLLATATTAASSTFVLTWVP